MKILIHLEHFRDHYPLCWTMEMDSQDFTATAIEGDVTCPECLKIIESWDEAQRDRDYRRAKSWSA